MMAITTSNSIRVNPPGLCDSLLDIIRLLHLLTIYCKSIDIQNKLFPAPASCELDQALLKAGEILASECSQMDGRNTVTNPVSGRQQFFRLSQ
jgi:hypothetical protein